MSETSNVVYIAGHDSNKYRRQGMATATGVFIPEVRQIILRDYHLGKNVILISRYCAFESEEYELFRQPDYLAAVREALQREMQLHVLIKPPDHAHASLRIQLFRHRDMYWERWCLYAISQRFWLI